MKTSGNTILITGGGSGIGQALAQRFHDLGNIVIIAGRRTEALQRTIAGRRTRLIETRLLKQTGRRQARFHPRE
jgi:short-subunit dehydrogenase involved in D-alanine esterification of teichoic acids